MDDFMHSYPILRVVEHSDSLRSFYFEATADVLPGQFIMVWIPGVDEKPFSVSDIHQGRMEVTVKALGPFTRRLMQCRVGDLVGLRGPFGLPFVATDDALIVGGGCGVAPVRFLHQTMKRQGRPCTFLVGTRLAGELMFRDEYGAGDVIIVTDDGSLGEARLLPDKAAELLKSYPTKFEIPVALEVTITSKEVLVRRPAPPGIRHFFGRRSPTSLPRFGQRPQPCALLFPTSAQRYE